jgi:hypothetical protein
MTDARVHLPGALDAAIQQVMFSALDEFFRASNVWQEDVPVPITPGVVTYDVDPEDVTSSKTVRLMQVLNTALVPVFATMETIGELVLGNTPVTAEVLTATIAVTVGDPTSSDGFPIFPSWLMEKYREGFLCGVLGKMMMQPAKVYSNQTLAVYHLRRFEGVKSQAKSDVRHKNIYGAQAWRFPGGW